jgi:hypothetical protein
MVQPRIRFVLSSLPLLSPSQPFFFTAFPTHEDNTYVLDFPSISLCSCFPSYHDEGEIQPMLSIILPSFIICGKKSPTAAAAATTTTPGGKRKKHL